MATVVAILVRTWTILAIFDLHLILMHPTKFQVYWPKSEKQIFKMAPHSSHLGFPIGMILAIFDL